MGTILKFSVTLASGIAQATSACFGHYRYGSAVPDAGQRCTKRSVKGSGQGRGELAGRRGGQKATAFCGTTRLRHAVQPLHFGRFLAVIPRLFVGRLASVTNSRLKYRNCLCGFLCADSGFQARSGRDRSGAASPGRYERVKRPGEHPIRPRRTVLNALTDP